MGYADETAGAIMAEYHYRCGAAVSFEAVSDGYYAQCPTCDEDVYKFELANETEDDWFANICLLFPYALLEEGYGGELVINTGLRVVDGRIVRLVTEEEVAG